MKKIISFFSTSLLLFFAFVGPIFAQPVPVSTEPTLELNAEFSYETGSLVGQEVTPPLRIQVNAFNLPPETLFVLWEKVWINSESENTPSWSNVDFISTDSTGSFQQNEHVLSTSSEATIGSETVAVENYIVKTYILNDDYPEINNLLSQTTLSLPQENNPTFSIQNENQTVSGGVTTGVTYDVVGEGLFPNTEYVVSVEIHAENEVGLVVYQEEFTPTTGGTGGFTLTPPSWSPTEVNQTNQGGGTLEQIQNSDLNTEAIDIFVIKATLERSPENLTDSVEIETQGVAETVDPESVNSADDCVDGNGIYCLLEPIGTDDSPWTYINVREAGAFGKYLNGMFQIGVALAGIIGVLLIVVGGFQYMTTDAIMKKEDGRKQIMNAVYGVILALTSWLILNTINPGLLNFSIGAYEVDGGSNGSSSAGTGVLIDAEENVTGMCQSIAQAAADAAAEGYSSCQGPDGGNLACAWLVDNLINETTGSFVAGGSSPTTYTPTLVNAFEGNSSYALVGSVPGPISANQSQVTALQPALQAGDIIISPSQSNPRVTGHTGICVSSDCGNIVSNNSPTAQAEQNFTFSEWVSHTRYSQLPLHFFRHTDCVQEG